MRDFTSFWKKKKGKTDKGFTLKRRTGRGLAAGRHWAGPAARPHARRGHVGGGFPEIRLRAGEAVTAEAVST